MYKICIWENIASPHQSYFFEALSKHNEIDLQVRYFEKFHHERIALGWRDNTQLPVNEQYVVPDISQALKTMEDWGDRIHVIPGISYLFTQDLLEVLISKNVQWIHWSERSGIGLARKLHYNVPLFKVLQPIVSKILKKEYAAKINRHALGVFAQGVLATRDFVSWGINPTKIEHLFYTIDKMEKPETLPNDLIPFSQKRIFLYAGSLYKLKGIRELLLAFSKLKNHENWMLVLVGQDRSNGMYSSIAKKLKISEQVVFTGPKPIETMPQYIGSSDVFVLPTLFDGWGAVLNEAAALGKAMISTDQCGASFHLIEENKNGFRVQAGNIEALKKAMQFYIDKPEKVEEHGQCSQHLYQNSFTPEANVKRFTDAIKKWTNKKI